MLHKFYNILRVKKKFSDSLKLFFFKFTVDQTKSNNISSTEYSLSYLERMGGSFGLG